MKPEIASNEAANQGAMSLDYLHSAAVVDSEGNETPITEEMILKACKDLENELN